MNDAINAGRPVAFRVLKHRLSSGYDIYDNEDDAQFLAGERGVSYEGLYLVSDRNTWDCAARKQSLPEPADCDWPTCGCDPYADKVIASLEESGIDLSSPNEREAIANLVRMFIGTEVALVACGTRYKARPFDALIDAILAVRLDEAAIRKDEREKCLNQVCESLFVIVDGWKEQPGKEETAAAVSNAAVFICGKERATAIARIDIALTAARTFTNAAKEKI